jgi:TatD DNase family protein
VLWLVELGHFLSFTGIATYPHSAAIHETIKNCPLNQLMIETDAPYLAPVPHRGKRNEPAYVMEVAKEIAKLKGLSLEEVDAATTKNAIEFFGLQH